MKKLIITFSICVFAMYTFGENPDKTTAKTTAKSEASASSMAPLALVGKVVDHKTGEALAGVEVNLYGTDVKTYTDFEGNFKFENLKPGGYAVVARYISYDLKVDNILVKNGDKNNFVMKLQEIQK